MFITAKRKPRRNQLPNHTKKDLKLDSKKIRSFSSNQRLLSPKPGPRLQEFDHQNLSAQLQYFTITQSIKSFIITNKDLLQLKNRFSSSRESQGLKVELRNLQLKNLQLQQKLNSINFSLTKLNALKKDPEMLKKLASISLEEFQALKQSNSSLATELVAKNAFIQILKAEKKQLVDKISAFQSQSELIRMKDSTFYSKYKQSAVRQSTEIAQSKKMLMKIEVNQLNEQLARFKGVNQQLTSQISTLKNQNKELQKKLSQLQFKAGEFQRSLKVQKQLVLGLNQEIKECTQVIVGLKMQKQVFEKAFNTKVVQQKSIITNLQRKSNRIQELEKNLDKNVDGIFKSLQLSQKQHQTSQMKGIYDQKIRYINYIHKEKFYQLNTMLSQVKLHALTLAAEKDLVNEALKKLAAQLSVCKKSEAQINFFLKSSWTQLQSISKRVNSYSKQCMVCKQVAKLQESRLRSLSERLQLIKK